MAVCYHVGFHNGGTNAENFLGVPHQLLSPIGLTPGTVSQPLVSQTLVSQSLVYCVMKALRFHIGGTNAENFLAVPHQILSPPRLVSQSLVSQNRVSQSLNQPCCQTVQNSVPQNYLR